MGEELPELPVDLTTSASLTIEQIEPHLTVVGKYEVRYAAGEFEKTLMAEHIANQQRRDSVLVSTIADLEHQVADLKAELAKPPSRRKKVSK